MAQLIWALISKVFVYIAAGAAAGRLAGGRGEALVKKSVWTALYVLIPAFLTLSLWRNTVPFVRSARLAAAAAAVMLFCAALAWIWSAASGVPFRDRALPVIFMNSAYLALPINRFIGGVEAFNYALIYNVVATLAQFTFGVWWVSRSGSAAEIFELPAIYAITAGLALNVLSVPVPGFIAGISDILTAVSLPFMLFIVGYGISGIRAGVAGRAFIGVAFRMGGGLLAAVAAIKLFGISGAAAGVCLITSSMPAAVNTYLFADYFGLDSEFAAAAVLLGTLAALITVPLIVRFAGL